MGLNLRTVDFKEWVESVGEPLIPRFLERLEEKIGSEITVEFQDWKVIGGEYPRVGSYRAYGIFRDCLLFLTTGDFENELNSDEVLERIALESFRQNLKPSTMDSSFVDHFLVTNDTSTVFLPLFFEKPIQLYRIDIASLPAASRALESFAKAIGFNLRSDFDNDSFNDEWIPIATAKNVARTIYQFFTKNPDSCVMFS
jgi:hypothetical protein